MGKMRQGHGDSWRCAHASREAGKVSEHRRALRGRFLQRKKGRGVGHRWQSLEKVLERKK